MGWKTGFEPATSGTTIQRSNQLSYNHRLASHYHSRNYSFMRRRQRYFFL